MKLALVTHREFDEIWANLEPHERFTFESQLLGCEVRLTDTLVIVNPEQVTASTVLEEIDSAHKGSSAGSEAVPTV